MKKILFVAVILVTFLAFLAIPNSQAGAAKPIRWKAIVTGTNLWGASGEFVGGVNQVNINNGVGTNSTPPPCNTAGTGSYSYLELQVFTPSLMFSMDANAFQGSPDDHSSYGFPKNNAPWPVCIADFLNSNNPHPTADYPHIILKFTTCGCGNTTTDLMGMADGSILPVHLELLFFSHIWGCPPSSPFTQETFLNLQMMAHGYAGAIPADINGSTYDVYIKRVGNTWTAYVDTVFNNGQYPPPPDNYSSAIWPLPIGDGIIGQYATCASIKTGKKTTWTTTYHYPWAKAPLQFQIAFTKY